MRRNHIDTSRGEEHSREWETASAETWGQKDCKGAQDAGVNRSRASNPGRPQQMYMHNFFKISESTRNELSLNADI